MATKLKGLKVTSVDVVDNGANPDSFLRLFKRKAKDKVMKEAETFSDVQDKEAIRELSCEMYDFCYALSDSFASILYDEELDEDRKRELLFTSLDEFAETIRDAAPKWAAGKCAEDVSKRLNYLNGNRSIEEKAARDAFLKRFDIGVINNSIQKENTENMEIDKSKMTADELTVFADYEKRYGITKADGEQDKDKEKDGKDMENDKPEKQEKQEKRAPELEKPIELHPDVKKAISDLQDVAKAQSAKIEELTKSLEIERLMTVAKQYDLIGKKADELAPKLYELKKAGGTAYDDYVALLNEHLITVEKSGLLNEIGKNTSGPAGTFGKINAAAAEIAKAGSMSNMDAIVKAFESNPELAAQYENEYVGGVR